MLLFQETMRPKMATRAQKQTLWAWWLWNASETLEPHLAEIKQQREWKFWHPEPLAHGNLLHTILCWENRRAAMPPGTGSKCALETFNRPTDEHQVSHGIPPATPRLNQHSSLCRVAPPHTHTQNWTINKDLKTNIQQRDRVAESEPEKGWGARSWPPCKLSVNKG
jgi:hypothetical protein